MPKYGKILSKLVPVLGIYAQSNICHEFIEAWW